MEFRHQDLRIDMIRRIDQESCAVRVTHLPTGTTAYADEHETASANRELALARLAEALGDDA